VSFADQAATAADPDFTGRVIACAVQESETFINDTRPEFTLLARQIIGASGSAAALVPLVAARPGITTASADPDILAAVQYVWPVYGATLVPPA
jgi:hypothetical protein